MSTIEKLKIFLSNFYRSSFSPGNAFQPRPGASRQRLGSNLYKMVMESSRWTEDTAALEDTVYNHPMAPNMQIAKAARMEMRDQYYKTFLT